MSMLALEINDLHKNYGNIKAVNELNMSIEKGSIFGFLGENGAGKTTTLRMITGLAKPSSGNIKVYGEEVKFGSCNINKHIGYLPDVPEFYGFMKPYEYLELCAKLDGMNSNEIKNKCCELMDLVGLNGIKRKISGFSRGMKQRLGVAQALLNEPELLILDEPTSALDPAGRKEILDIIMGLKGKMTILFSTHILSDVERICDTIGIIHHGKIALECKMDDLHKKYASQSVLIEIGKIDKVQELKQKLLKFDFIKSIRAQKNELIVNCTDRNELSNTVCPILSGMDIPLIKFEQIEPNLEEVFIEVIKDA